MERYEAYKDSGVEWIGEIPAEWETRRIKTAVRRKGETGHPEETVLSLYRDYGIVIKDSRDDNFNRTSENTDSYRFVEINDLVVNKMKAWQGSLAISGFTGIVSPAYYVYQITDDRIVPRYMHYQLRDTSYLPEYRRLSGGIRPAQWDLSSDNFVNIPMLVPPTREQQAIAEYLDAKTAEIDGLVADCEREVGLLQEYRKAVISEAVTKGLDPNVPTKNSGVEWIGEIPEGWNVDKAVRIFGNIGSGTTPKTDVADYYDGAIPWVQSGDLGEWNVNQTSKSLSELALRDFSALSMYQAPFIAVAMYGASIGSMSVVQVDACVNQACCVLSECRGDQGFYAYAFSAAKAFLIDQGIGGTQPNISQALIKALWLPCPPILTQRAIVDYLNVKTAEIDALIDEKQSMADKLREYRKSLVSEVVTGKFKVPGVD